MKQTQTEIVFDTTPLSFLPENGIFMAEDEFAGTNELSNKTNVDALISKSDSLPGLRITYVGADQNQIQALNSVISNVMVDLARARVVSKPLISRFFLYPELHHVYEKDSFVDNGPKTIEVIIEVQSRVFRDIECPLPLTAVMMMKIPDQKDFLTILEFCLISESDTMKRFKKAFQMVESDQLADFNIPLVVDQED